MFREIFGTGKKDKTLVERFFYELADYLDTAQDIVEAKKLADWIRNGNKMSCFSCRSDLADDMSWQLVSDNIPFVVVTEKTGRTGFAIRECDAKKTGKARDAVLEAKARYCRITTGEGLKEIMSQTKDRDKEVLYISGLTAEETDLLRAKCEETLDGNDIGIDEMEDGTFTFSFIGKKALKHNGRDGMNLARALLEAMMAANGPNRVKNQRMARNRIALEQAAGRRFRKNGIDLDVTPAWVMGKDSQYMRIDSTGFEHGRAVTDEYGDTHLIEEYTGDVSMPDYDAQLVSHLAHFTDGAYTYDANAALRHYAAPDKSTAVIRSDKNDRIISHAERDIVSAIDGAVLRKAQKDPISQMRGRWGEKLENYIKNATRLLDAVVYPETALPSNEQNATQERINGFLRADMTQLQNVIAAYDVDMQLYANAMERIQEIDIRTDEPMFARYDRSELETRLNARSDGHDIDPSREEERKRFTEVREQ